MVPLHLTLCNFLSYGHGEVDFTGLHTACICGSNGAGKSALLEALGWALWGKSRAVTEDDLIRTGTAEAMVDLTFRCDQAVYRVLRLRPRGKTGTLEFQIRQDNGDFRTLSARTLRQTQEAINNVLKMDYETFINSAYLRQGRADEFTLKKASERKEVLAEILGLNRYELLAERAKDKARESKNQSERLKEYLEKVNEKLKERDGLRQQETTIEVIFKSLQEEQVCLETQARLLEQQVQLLAQSQQHAKFLEDSIETKNRSLRREENQYEQQGQSVKKLLDILNQKLPITQKYQEYQLLIQQDEQLNQAQMQYQELTEERQILERVLDQEKNRLENALQSFVARLELWQEEKNNLLRQVADSERVETGFKNYQLAAAKLKAYEQLQAVAEPQVQERNRLILQLKSQGSELEGQINHANYQYKKLGGEIASKNMLDKQLEQLNQEIQKLERQKIYQDRVKEKGSEKRGLAERQKAQLEDRQDHLAKLNKKAVFMEDTLVHCPVCSQELNEEHRQQIQQEYQQNHTQLQEEVLLLEHQLSYTNQEVTTLIAHWFELNSEVEVLDKKVKVQAQLQQEVKNLQEKRQQMEEFKQLERNLKHQLEKETYGLETRQALHLVELELRRLAYDENDYAVLRGEWSRLHWAEGESKKLADARQRLQQLDEEIPALEQRCHNGRYHISNRMFLLGEHENLKQLQTKITELIYDPKVHQHTKSLLQIQRTAQYAYEELQRAEKSLPIEETRLHQLQEELTRLQQEHDELQKQYQQLQLEISQLIDPVPLLATQAEYLQTNRIHQNQQLEALGGLRRSLEHLAQLEKQQAGDQQEYDYYLHQFTLHQELGKAFGKNGIQSLIIESILPELEADTNQLLARLSENQLHVNFQPQRADKKGTKMIETLDILIADSRGTRPYETYSGGEAFRVNFAIRLALSRLLARRAGAALQTLIIDEGFGSQDQGGRERLVEAINMIAGGFERIFVITHVNDLKEVFPARIEVAKGEHGSQLSVIL